MNLLHLRQQIDGIDRSLLQLLAQRFILVRETKTFKTAVKDSKREEEVRRHWMEECERLGLDSAFAVDLLERVLAESRRLQTLIA